ncbi:hypothetical protein CEXT_556191 [Caerostris extrusa]|uniref:Uncharacterized protein n=1 Tax=Caerostris extrusa TaxID=172846 RepID=A0AAV4WG87_CAEEX|nr:hypothetical protein CEXT_556191 [Caerostris extrusa]
MKKVTVHVTLIDHRHFGDRLGVKLGCGAKINDLNGLTSTDEGGTNGRHCLPSNLLGTNSFSFACRKEENSEKSSQVS